MPGWVELMVGSIGVLAGWFELMVGSVGVLAGWIELMVCSTEVLLGFNRGGVLVDRLYSRLDRGHGGVGSTL